MAIGGGNVTTGDGEGGMVVLTDVGVGDEVMVVSYCLHNDEYLKYCCADNSIPASIYAPNS
jgi:hypothetical protein